jgi:hypothetical protein
LIRKLALNPNELASLPGNYAAARTALPLPDLFGKDAGWVEVQWFPHRLHDSAAGYRRVTRVFLKPTRAQPDMQKFLTDLRHYENQLATLDGVALVVQPLLVDPKGRLQPTNLTIDVQLRLFHKTSAGAFERTEVAVYEISRWRLLVDPASGGLVAEAETDPAYLSSGGDYGFGSDPVIVRLRTRCVLCHGSGDLTNLMIFSMMVPPENPVRRLDPAAHEAAEFVFSQKAKAEDWMALSKAFEGARP